MLLCDELYMVACSCRNDFRICPGIIMKLPCRRKRLIKRKKILQTGGIAPANSGFRNSMAAHANSFGDTRHGHIGTRQPEKDQMNFVALPLKLLQPRSKCPACQ